MRIPRYWSRAQSPAVGRSRRPGPIAWGWSSESVAQARQLAERRLARLVERLERGEPLPRAGYLYGDRPLREEIVEEVSSAGPGQAVVVTRNGYGALVLNAAGAMFVDVDRPSPPRAGLLARLFGRSTGPDAAAEGRQLADLRGRLEHLPGSYRVYRTAAGWRVLATDRLHDPSSESTQSLMESMGADPAYRTLCRVQESFRARLTPKPWRCGRPNPPGRFPRDDRTQLRFDRWLRRYEEACRPKATCRFLDSVGAGRIAPQIAPVLALHDRHTRVGEELPLA